MTDLLARETVRAPAARRGAVLLGVGTASPPPLSQAEAIGLAQRHACETEGQRAWLKRVFSRAGVEERGSVLMGAGGVGDIERFYVVPTDAGGPTTGARMERYALEAPPLAQRAAAEALADAGVRAGEITHLITVSCTGFFAPGLDVAMIQRLGLSPAVRRMQIGFMGCHAGFNALGAARDIVLAHREARVLVCCVELSTLHFAFGWMPEKLVANALFADGASACVVGAGGEIVNSKLKIKKEEGGNGFEISDLRSQISNLKFQSSDFRSQISELKSPGSGRWRLLQTASLLLPASADAMTWRIGDHGFEMTLSAELPALIQTHLRPWCEGWLAEEGLGLADVTHWAIHPGGPKIIEAAAASLGVGASATAVSYEVLARQGNMSSATVLFLLEALARRGSGPGLCVAIGFGPGLMAEGMLLEM